MDLPRLSTKTDDKILDENTANRAETHAVRGKSVYSLVLLQICTISARFCTLSGFCKMAVRRERGRIYGYSRLPPLTQEDLLYLYLTPLGVKRADQGADQILPAVPIRFLQTNMLTKGLRTGSELKMQNRWRSKSHKRIEAHFLHSCIACFQA